VSRASPLRLGVSACLLGERVRWDGDHKRADDLLAALDGRVEWVPVCPEMAIGLGAPREPIELVEDAGRVRLVGAQSRVDHTDAMERWACAHLDELERLRLHGFVLKARSPSCGLAGVNLRRTGGDVRPDGRGVFARALVERFARLPVEEETRLTDTAERTAFLRRVRAYARLTESR
jgi:uncharacterized protein YbbK (DUF523 family)